MGVGARHRRKMHMHFCRADFFIAVEVLGSWALWEDWSAPGPVRVGAGPFAAHAGGPAQWFSARRETGCGQSSQRRRRVDAAPRHGWPLHP